MSVVCRECGIEFEKDESLRRHTRKHKMSFQEYSLKWMYGGQIPLCKCGCKKFVRWNIGYGSYTEYVKGHSSLGKHRTLEEKRKIGEKNSIHMKKFMLENPKIAYDRVQQMLSGRTDESESVRIQATKDAYENMSEEDLQKFSNHSKSLWESGAMNGVSEKQSKTFKERFAAGEYDFTERNQKISATVSQLYVDGGFSWSKGEYASTKVNKTFYYRSSWEKQYMEILDSDDSVGLWDYEFVFIPYTLNGVRHNYVPDFYVKMRNGIEKLVEIKPENLKLTSTNCAKKEAAIAWCNERGWIYEERSFE